jgi:hypothetical protein
MHSYKFVTFARRSTLIPLPIMTWNSNDGFVRFTNSIPHEAIDSANSQIQRFVSRTFSSIPTYVPQDF